MTPLDMSIDITGTATPTLIGEALGHPLLPRTRCVRNDARPRRRRDNPGETTHRGIMRAAQ